MSNSTFTINILGNNESTLLPRIVLAFNRRRIHIKSINAMELNNKVQYYYSLIIETSPVWAERVSKQLEKQIDIHTVNYFKHEYGVPLIKEESNELSLTH